LDFREIQYRCRQLFYVDRVNPALLGMNNAAAAAWVPFESNGLKAFVPFLGHGTGLSSLETLELLALMLAPYCQGRIMLVRRWYMTMSMCHYKGFQGLKMLLPTSSMRSPDESDLTKSFFSFITQSRVLSLSFELVLIALTIRKIECYRDILNAYVVGMKV
jgi:hypothetical protein